MPHTPLLDTVKYPADMDGFSREQLKQLADEVRAEVVDAVSVTGGHLGAGLGVVELTVAIHSVFNTPDDKLIWDVGHQCYPHKVLTGRRDRIRTLRKGGGLSGFTKRAESEYDPFGAAHSSTSISAGMGFAAARDCSPALLAAAAIKLCAARRNPLLPARRVRSKARPEKPRNIRVVCLWAARGSRSSAFIMSVLSMGMI